MSKGANADIGAAGEAGGGAVPSSGAWRTEARALIGLGAPMALTQLVQFSINTVDVLMIGRLGPEALAGSALGLVVFFAGFLIGYGPAMAVAPLVSQRIGADPGDTRDVRRSVRMGLWALALLFPALLIPFSLVTPIALALGQPEGAARLAGPYVLAIAPGWFFFMGVLVLRNFLAALDRTRAPLVFIIGTTFLNAVLNYLLIFGAFGFPRLELVGAGIASSIANATGFFLLAGYCRWESRARAYAVFENIFRPDWERLREVVALGWPIGVSTAFEGLLFNASLFLMGRIGVAEMAAYQVALNVAALAFMAPLGMSMAGSVRVGLHAGAGRADGVRRASFLTIGFSVAAIAIAAAVVLAAPGLISGLYLSAQDPSNATVLPLVASFLRIAAGFMLFDAIQVAAHQCLRGLKDVRMPMIMTGVAYWGVGFPTAAFLGLATPVGAPGVWFGLMGGLAVAAVLLSGRLVLLTRPARG